MSQLVTGEPYVAAMSAERSDQVARADFVELALKLVPAGGRIFDFGSGPGLDARAYAEGGHEVHAFDVDADMCASFRRTCAAGVAGDRIHLIQSSFESFLAESQALVPPVDLITANFAPLNLVPEPAPLFRKFHSMLNDNGRVLASLLNPFHGGDLRYGWWWRGLPALLLRGRFAVQGSQAPVTRWLPARLAREAEPLFSLESIVMPGVRCEADDALRIAYSGARGGRPAPGSGRYQFLVMRKRPQHA